MLEITSTHCLGDMVSHAVVLFQILLSHDLASNEHKRLSLHGHELAGAVAGLSCLVVQPRLLLRVGHSELGWPACNMDLYALAVFVKPEQTEVPLATCNVGVLNSQTHG